MELHEDYFISYPEIKHPLAAESLSLKLKYVSLLEYYRKRICPSDISAQNRLNRFKHDFLSDFSPAEQDIDSATKAIMKTRFTPFHFFSYRYLFLFDCVYLLCIDGFAYVREIREQIKTSVNKRYHTKIDAMLDAMISNPPALSNFSMITSEMIQSLTDSQKFLNTIETSIVFTATMSAGKSTLINALIGQPLAKAKKAACTAAISEFCSCPVFHRKSNVFIDGKEIRDLLPKDICAISANGTKPLTVTSFFNSRTKNQKLRIIDTPGANSAQNPQHKEITRAELSGRSHDLLVYVIPVENYGSEDDLVHLTFIKEKANYKKIIFVVNMIDTCDFEDDSVAEIMNNIREHLEKIGFLNPVLCPLSAKVGLLFKRVLSGTALTAKEKAEFDTYFAKYQNPDYDMSPFYTVTGEDHFCNEWYPIEELSYDQVHQLYLRTGLPQFESTILKSIKEA